jgi:hypothetical protein
MGFLAFGTIVVISLIVGVAVQNLIKGGVSYQWFIVALSGAFGAVFGSEAVVGSTVPLLDGIKEWGPQFDGMFIIPAVICGVLIALIADIGVRTGEAPQAAA